MIGGFTGVCICQKSLSHTLKIDLDYTSMLKKVEKVEKLKKGKWDTVFTYQTLESHSSASMSHININVSYTLTCGSKMMKKRK